MLYTITTLASDVVDSGTEILTNERVVTIDEYWLNLIISFFLPVAVAFVTKRFADSSVKALLLALLSVVTGWLTSVQAAGGAFELESALTSILVSFAMAVASHFGLWAPAHVTGRNGAIAVRVPGGIGTEHPRP